MMTTPAQRTYQDEKSPDARPLAVGLGDIKKHLKISWDEEDDLIVEYIRAATKLCEDWQGRKYIVGQIAEAWNCFPCGRLYLRWAPMVLDDTHALTLSYYDSDGNLTTLVRDTDFRLLQYATPPYLRPMPNAAWPTVQGDRDDAVQLVYYAGSGLTEGQAPTKAKQAIRFLTAHQYRNREAVLTGTISKEIEFGVKALLGPQRLIPMA